MSNISYGVGDKITILATPSTSRLYPANMFGKVHTIRRVHPKVGSIAIEGRYGWIDINNIERAPAARADEVKVGTFVIMLQHPNGTLAPSTTPRKYSSDVQANKVAAQMAKKHGGTFLVFRATDEHVMPIAAPTHRAL